MAGASAESLLDGYAGTGRGPANGGSGVQRQATGAPPAPVTTPHAPPGGTPSGPAASTPSGPGGSPAAPAVAPAVDPEAYHASTSAQNSQAPASRNANWSQVQTAATDAPGQQALDIDWIDGLPNHLKDSIDEGFADSVKDASVAHAKVTDTGLKTIDQDINHQLKDLQTAAVARLAATDPTVARKRGRELEQALARDQAFMAQKNELEADRRRRKEEREVEISAAADGPMAAGSRADTVVKPPSAKVTRLEGKALARTNFMSWAIDVLGSEQAAKQHFLSIREVARQPGMFLMATAKARFEAARADFEGSHPGYTFPSTDVAQHLRGFHQARQGIGMLGHALGVAFDLLAYDNPNQKLGQTDNYGYMLNRFGGVGNTRGRSVMNLGVGGENTVAQLGRDTAAGRSSPAGDAMVETIHTQFDEMVATSERLRASMAEHLPQLSEARDLYFNSKDTEKDLAKATADEKNSDKVADKQLKDEHFNGTAAEKTARHEAIKQELLEKKRGLQRDLEAARASIDTSMAEAFADWIATINADIAAARARKATSDAEVTARAAIGQQLDAIDAAAPGAIDALNAFADQQVLKKPRQIPRAAAYKALLKSELRAKQKPRDKSDPLSPEYIQSEIAALDAWLARLGNPKQVFGQGKVVPAVATTATAPASTATSATGTSAGAPATQSGPAGSANAAANQAAPGKHWATQMQVTDAPVMQFIEHGFIRHDDMPQRPAGGVSKQVFNAEVATTLARYGFSPGAAFRDTMHFDFIEGYSAAPGGRGQANMNKNKYGPSGDVAPPAPRNPAPAAGSR